MQTKPNKPEVFAGWQDVFPPISLNFKGWFVPFAGAASPFKQWSSPFKKCVLPFIQKPTTFREKWLTICRQYRIIPTRITASSVGVSVAAVCRKAYPISYDRSGLCLAIIHPHLVEPNLHHKN